jgi:NADP-dependent 3-hydroxy acid dehydrogenase YdfG
VVAISRSIEPSNDDEVVAVSGDIGDCKTAERVMIAEGVTCFGRIDTLIDNAGIFIAKPFTQYTEELKELEWCALSDRRRMKRNRSRYSTHESKGEQDE